MILAARLRTALQRLNPGIPSTAIDSAVLQLSNPHVPGLLAANRQMHRWLTQGLPITVMEAGEQRGIRLKLIDFDDPRANYWLVVNQLQTYKTHIPDLFIANMLLVISDGVNARVGSLSADRERFQQWRVIDQEQELDPLGKHRELETLVRGVFDPRRFLDFLHFFCLFKEDGRIIKKIAAYHQFHAVRAALERVVQASRPSGDRKGGVVWHTQGAGKSIEMACLAGMLLLDPRLGNPTLVIVTDRQDLIKALLKRYKYPPDKEPAAIELVLQQTEVISEEWAREDLGRKIQETVAAALTKSFVNQETLNTP